MATEVGVEGEGDAGNRSNRSGAQFHLLLQLMEGLLDRFEELTCAGRSFLGPTSGRSP